MATAADMLRGLRAVDETDAAVDDDLEPGGTGEQRARFDDAYWDDAFCAWWDPALRTCCG